MKKQCNFCGRSDREVKLLITGINGYICEDCAKQAYQIVQQSGYADNSPAKNSNEAFNSTRVPKPKEIKDYSMSEARTRQSAFCQ